MYYDTINIALENLLLHHGIKGKFKEYPNPLADGIIEFHLDNARVNFLVFVKQDIRVIQRGQLQELKRHNKNIIVIAVRFLNVIKQQLRDQGIAYLETNGNIYLKTQKTFVWLETQRPLPKTKTTNRAFTKTGLQVVFEILLNPDILKLTQREIAETTKVALGQVNNVMTGLKQMEFIIQKSDKVMILHRIEELLGKWVEYFADRLKNTLLMGKFKFVNKEDFNYWNDIEINANLTFWGGEPAGYLLTKYLHPAKLTLYTEENRQDLMKNLKLIPDANGNIEIYKKFWHTEWINTKVVPDILAYADLINSNDTRCIETAEKLYNEQIENRFR